MDRNGADLIVEILKNYGVTKVFGNPGTTELPVINSVSKSESVDYIMSLHEDISMGAASGYSNRMRFQSSTNQESLSVVNLHTTPGLGHAIGNLYSASFVGAPVIVTTGSQRESTERRGPPLSGNRQGLVKDLTKYSTRVNTVDEINEKFKKAAEEALEQPTGPVYVDIPLDVQNASTNNEPLPINLEQDASSRLGDASDESIEEAVQSLASSQEPVVVVGNALSHAGEDAIQDAISIAEMINADIHGEVLLSEISIPTSHPNWISTLGIHQDDIEPFLDTDTVLFIGCRTESPIIAEDADSMISDDTRTVHVGYNTECIGTFYNNGVNVAGDIESSLSRIADGLEDKGLERNKRVSANQQESEESYGFPPSPESVARAIDRELDDTIVVDEGVTSGFIMRNTVDFDTGQLYGQKSGCLGYGLPASLGVAIAEEEIGSDKKVLCYVGDGSYQYYPQSLYTADRYIDSALSVILVDNGGYEILRDADVIDDKSDTTDESLTFNPGIDATMNAKSYGIEAMEFENGEDLNTVISDTIYSDEVRFLTIPISESEENHEEQ